MRKIYLLDTAMPIPNEESLIHSYKEIISKPVEDLNTSYTNSVLTWAKKEFDKILKNVGVSTEFDFSNIVVTFFRNQYLNETEASFYSERGLISIGVESYCTGRESNIQTNSIHEFAHAVTASSHLVGIAVTEGIAQYLEKLYCQFYEITHNDAKKDEGYIFSENLINSIILNVYNSNLETFFERIKKGNEREFINDIDTYLKSQNIGYSANELLRLSSILFYAKKLPSSPFEEYHKNSEIEQLRKDILQCFSGRESVELNDYNATIRYIINIYDKIYSKYKGNLNTFSNTFDRELGLAMVNNNNLPLQIETVKNAYNKTANIINTDSTTKTNNLLPNDDEHSDNDNR